MFQKGQNESLAAVTRHQGRSVFNRKTIWNPQPEVRAGVLVNDSGRFEHSLTLKPALENASHKSARFFWQVFATEPVHELNETS